MTYVLNIINNHINPFLLVSHSALDSPLFREWQMLPRALKLLSAYRMRTSVLDKLSSSVDKRQSDCLERHSNWTLSIDGWTDSSHNNLLAVLLEDKEMQHYLGKLELGDEKHTADNIHRALVSLLGEKIKLIKGFVTDNPNVMLKLRSQFCTEFSLIYNLKCLLHVLNLVSKDVIWSTEAKIIAGQINKLAVFFPTRIGVLFYWIGVKQITWLTFFLCAWKLVGIRLLKWLTLWFNTKKDSGIASENIERTKVHKHRNEE